VKERAVVRSQVFDKVNMCLVDIPKSCAAGDNRGRVYKTTNLRTGESWELTQRCPWLRVVRSFGIPLVGQLNDGVVQFPRRTSTLGTGQFRPGRFPVGVSPTISCINVGPVPQALGHSRAMWYPASTLSTAHT